MNLNDLEKCPRCNHRQVYAGHVNDTWKVFCDYCGLQTHTYTQWESARAEWDKMIKISRKGEK